MELSDEEWVNLLRASVTSIVAFNSEDLPGFPPEKLQISTVGVSGSAAINAAWDFAKVAIAHFRASPLFANPDKKLLDFGIGWARIARCFLRDFERRHIVGVDINPKFIDICEQIFPGPRYICCNALPPVDVATGSIDFVVGYSVFSHLSEIACLAWAKEFSYLLKEGGMVALTTRSGAFFDWHKRHVVAVGGKPIFADYDLSKSIYDQGKLVHSEYGFDPRNHYGETFIPREYASRAFTPLRLKEFYAGALQSTMIFEKTSSSSG